jgi:alginate O-acetyltransferase complex protein AlgJ
MTSTRRVTQSADGTLYLTGGTNAALGLYDLRKFKDQVPIADWRARLERRQREFQEIGAEWTMLFSPEKLSTQGLGLVREALGGNVRSPAASFEAEVGRTNILNPTNYLTSQSMRYKVYSKTDSHWTTVGAFSAFQLIHSALGIKIDYGKFLELPEDKLTYHGDLWSSDIGGEPEVFVRKRVPPSIRTVYKNPIVGLKERYNLRDEPGLHVGSHLVFFNVDAQRKEKLILFGSSFSEYRLECSLLTFMFAFHYEEVHFVWSSSIDFDYVRRHQPARVVVEMPERFIRSCPRDDACVERHGVNVAQDWRERIDGAT